MKRSTVFLVAALIIPAGISLLGVAAGVRQLKGGARSDLSDGISLNGENGSGTGLLEVVRDETVPVGADLALNINAAELDLQFDDALVSEGHLKIEVKGNHQVRIEIKPDEWTIEPVEKSDEVRVTIQLPTAFKSLAFELNAVRCNVNGRNKLKADLFKLILQAAKCDMSFDELRINKFIAEINAGKLDLNARRLAFVGITTGVFSLRNAAGSVEVHIAEAPEHSFRSDVSMGDLEVFRGDDHESIKGIGQGHRVEGPKGSPEFDIEVNVGKIEFRIDKIVPATQKI